MAVPKIWAGLPHRAKRPRWVSAVEKGGLLMLHTAVLSFVKMARTVPCLYDTCVSCAAREIYLTSIQPPSTKNL